MPDRLKALLVGNYREDTQFSMLGFGRSLVEGLPRHTVEVEFIAPKHVLPSPSGRLSKWFAYADKYILFPRELRRAANRADVVHILDQGNGIYVNHLRRVTHLVTCHDLLAIRSALGELSYWKTGLSGRFYQNAILRGLCRARFVACVSTATRRDAVRLLTLPESRLATVCNGLFSEWETCKGVPPPMACRNAGLSETLQYYLHVGNASPYKNRVGAIAIFAALRDLGDDSCLVLAGKPLAGSERAKVDSSGASHRILEFSGPTSADLAWLYSNAQALLVTSFDEGFGMPIIEAQACGCPVFVPAREPMTEVGGDGVITLDPSEPVAAAQRVLSSRVEFENLRQRGYNNVAKFSGSAMVEAYANLYGRLSAEGAA